MALVIASLLAQALALTVTLSPILERAVQPLTVVLERDGRFPDFAQMVGQLRATRRALAAGRSRAQLEVRHAA